VEFHCEECGTESLKDEVRECPMKYYELEDGTTLCEICYDIYCNHMAVGIAEARGGW